MCPKTEHFAFGQIFMALVAAIGGKAIVARTAVISRLPF
jgi:hypothetical protein